MSVATQPPTNVPVMAMHAMVAVTGSEGEAAASAFESTCSEDCGRKADMVDTSSELVRKLEALTKSGHLAVASHIVLGLKDLREQAQQHLLDNDKTPAETLLREKIEKSHQEADLLAKVRTIEHSTATLKLAQVQAQLAGLTEEERRHEDRQELLRTVTQLVELTRLAAEKTLGLRREMHENLQVARARELKYYRDITRVASEYRHDVTLVEEFQSPLVPGPRSR